MGWSSERPGTPLEARQEGGPPHLGPPHLASPPLPSAPAHPQTGALPGALDKDGGVTFEGPAPEAAGAPSPQLATCFWFVSIEGPPPAVGSVGSAASASSSAPGAPGTPVGSHEAAAKGARPAAQLQAFASRAAPPALEGLQMGPLIGSGSFGRGELAGHVWSGWTAASVWPHSHRCCSLLPPAALSASALPPLTSAHASLYLSTHACSLPWRVGRACGGGKAY